MVDTKAPQSVCLVMSNAPFASEQGKELLDMALAYATFDAKVSILFIEQGIFQLIRENDAKRLGLKDYTRLYTGLDLYDIDRLFASEASLDKYSIAPSQLFDGIEIVSNENLSKELAQADWVFTL